MAKGVTRRVNIYINGKEVEYNVKNIRTEMAKLVNEQNKMIIGSDEYVAHGKKLKELKSIIDDHNKSLQTGAKGWQTFLAKINQFGAGLGGFSMLFAQVNQGISKLKKIATDMAGMDDIYSNVQKYTGKTREEVLKLNQEFKEFDTRTAREELNRLAGEAGKLGGEAAKNIEDFVQAADIIQISLGEDLGEDAVKNVGKLVEMFGVSKIYGLKEAMLKTSSAINTVGQSSTAAEPYLLQFLQRTSGVGNQAKMTIPQLIAFGSVLDQNSQELEMSATALNRFIINIINNTKDVAKAAGIPLAELNQLIGTDMNAAVLRVFEALHKKGGLTDLAPLFKDLGADGQRAASIVAILSQKYPDLVKEQELATQAFNEGNSVIKEFNTKNNNMQAQLEKSRKKFQDMRLELGEKLYPVLIKLTSTGTAGIKMLSALIKFIENNIPLVVSLVAAYTVLLLIKQKNLILTKASILITKIETATLAASEVVFQSLALAKAILTKNTIAATVAQKALSNAFKTTPWGLILTVVTALGVAIWKFTHRTNEAEKAMKEFYEESSKEEASAKSLFLALKNTTKGSEEYKQQLEKLKELYPDIINAHINEKGCLINIKDAYDDVIVSIRAKIAAQIKESKVSTAVAKDIEVQSKAIAELRKKMTEAGIDDYNQGVFIDQLKKEIESGNSFDKVYKSMSSKFGFITKKLAGFWTNNVSGEIGNMITSNKELKETLGEVGTAFDDIIGEKPLRKITTLEEKLAELKKALAAAETKEDKKSIQAEIDIIKKQMKTPTDNIPPGGAPPGDDVIKKWKTFYEKLKNFRQKSAIDQLSDFEKEKAQIIAQYDEMITEAKNFGEKGKKIADELETEKNDSIIAAGQKYLNKYKDILAKIHAAAVKQLKTNENKEVNSLLSALSVSDENWNKIISDYEENLKILEELYAETLDPDEAQNVSQIITDTFAKMLEAIKAKTNDELTIIKNAQKGITEALQTEDEKQIAEIQKKYNTLIDIAKTSIDELTKLDPVANADLIEKLKKQIDELKKKLGEEIDNVTGKSGDNVWEDFFNIDWSKIGEDWRGGLKKIVALVEEVYSSIANIVTDIATIQNNAAETELNTFKATQEEKLEALQDRYDKGLISDSYYNSEKEKLEDETAAKEKQVALEQWKRNKAVATSEAIIQGALGALKSLASLPFPYGLIPMALSLAASAVQIAAIQSEPAPYARGGYVKEETVFKAGEQGEEWVASNLLLKNKKTAGMIAQLEAYQRGKNSIFDNMNVSVPDQKNLSQAATSISRNFVTTQTPVVNNYYQNNGVNETIKKMYNKFEEFTKYMSDPKNRRASVDRKLLSEFDNDESFLRNKSIL